MFAEGFDDQAGSGVAAEPMGGKIVKGQYVFGPGQGVQVPVAGLDLEDWVIEFELTVGVPAFALGKLVDFSDLELDRGLYRTLPGGVFLFLPPFSDTSVRRLEVGTPAVVRYARDAVTRTVSLAIDGVVQWVMPDPFGEAIPPGDGTITFFADDTVTGSQESCSGRVRWSRIGSASAGRP